MYYVPTYTYVSINMYSDIIMLMSKETNCRYSTFEYLI